MRSKVATGGRAKRAPLDETEQTGIPAWLLAGLNVVARRPLDSAGVVLALVATSAIMTNALFLQPGRHPAPLMARMPGAASPPVSQSTLTKAEATGTLDQPQPLPLPRPRPDGAAPRLASIAAPSPAAAPVASAAPAADVKAKSEITSGIQRELARRGLYDGTADGIWGPKTDAAARDLAQQAGIRIAVEASEPFLRAISRAPLRPAAALAAAPVAAPVAAVQPATPPASIPARNPDHSRRTLAVQRALTDFGYGQFKPNGVYGPETRAAIESFERERNLPITGDISPRLMRELAAITGRPLE